MKKILLAVVLGAALGAVDGLTAWLDPGIRSLPNAGAKLQSIMMWSSLKSIIAGFLIGVFAYFIRKQTTVLVFGLGIGLLLAYLVAMQPDPDTGKRYYLQIMLPGGIVGLILGYVTAKYGGELQPTSVRN